MTPPLPPLVALTDAICPLCATRCPLPPGISSPAFDKPDLPDLAEPERQRRVAIIAAWLDPIQQLLAAECQMVRTGRHEGVPLIAEFYPRSP